MTEQQAKRMAEGLRAKAQHHKSLARYHRRKTRDLMSRFEQFKARLAEIGIAVEGEGETIHGPKNRQPD